MCRVWLRGRESQALSASGWIRPPWRRNLIISLEATKRPCAVIRYAIRISTTIHSMLQLRVIGCLARIPWLGLNDGVSQLEKMRYVCNLISGLSAFKRAFLCRSTFCRLWRDRPSNLMQIAASLVFTRCVTDIASWLSVYARWAGPHAHHDRWILCWSAGRFRVCVTFVIRRTARVLHPRPPHAFQYRLCSHSRSSSFSAYLWSTSTIYERERRSLYPSQ